MADISKPGFHKLLVSGKVSHGPVLYYGIQIEATGTLETSKVYAGPDENEMYLFATYKNTVIGSEAFWLPEPLRFDQGLYIKLGDKVVSIVVLFDDLSS